MLLNFLEVVNWRTFASLAQNESSNAQFSLQPRKVTKSTRVSEIIIVGDVVINEIALPTNKLKIKFILFYTSILLIK